MVKYPVVGRLVYNPERDGHDFIPVEKQHKTLSSRRTVQFKYTFHNENETILIVYNVTSWSME